MNFQNLISGINYDFSNLLYKILPKYRRINDLKITFIDEINKFISQLLEKKEIGSTKIFNLKKLTNSPFLKYVNDILLLRKNEFEKIILRRINKKYNFTPFVKTYYGSIYFKLLKLPKKESKLITQDDLIKIKNYCDKLGLKLKIS